MTDTLKKELSDKLREIFEQSPVEIWPVLAIALLETIRELSEEYYNKGVEEMYNRFIETLKSCVLHREVGK